MPRTLSAQPKPTVLGGRYALEAPIGQGGMATVWRARHLTLGHPVAVKFIDREGHGDTIAEQFIREARVAAAIRHRNIVDIIDFGTAPDGRPYMVMELLEGRTLRAWLSEGALETAETVRVAARVLSGLGAVHDVGMLHRDLKPGNIFLVSDVDGEYPKLIDFGISKAVGSSRLESVMPSRRNVITGTPHYMSPEQARGLVDVDPRSDLFSMGIVLFEMLTGDVPFDAENVGDLLIQIATEDAPDIRRLRPDLPEPIARVVEIALERDPENRFCSARAMRKALVEAADRAVFELTESVRPEALSDASAVSLRRAVGDVVEPEDAGVLELLSVHPPPIGEYPTKSLGRVGASPPTIPFELSRLAGPAANDTIHLDDIVIRESGAHESRWPALPKRHRLVVGALFAVVGLWVLAPLSGSEPGLSREAVVVLGEPEPEPAPELAPMVPPRLAAEPEPEPKPEPEPEPELVADTVAETGPEDAEMTREQARAERRRARHRRRSRQRRAPGVARDVFRDPGY